MANDVAKDSPFDYKIMKSDPTELSRLVRENIGVGGVDQFTLSRVKIPTGGVTQFMIPDISGEDRVEKEIQGIIFLQRDVRQYWTRGVEQSGGVTTAPDCYSIGAEVGRGIRLPVFPTDKPGESHSCDACPLSQFGSGKGNAQACKMRKQIFFFAPDGVMPMVFSLPPSSLAAHKKYMFGLVSMGLDHRQVITAWTLVRKRSGGGVDYAMAQPKLVRVLEPDEMKIMAQHAKNFAELVRGAKIAEADAHEDSV